MKFVDEIKIEASAGHGGDGVVRWMQTRRDQKGGPSGGDGGRGGDVVVRAVRDIGILGKYKGDNIFRAENGGPGGKSSLHGKRGEDVVIDLPIGSVISLGKKEETLELLKEGDEIVVLKGGVGGYGNEHFKSSKNVRPQESTPGKLGEEDILHIELRLFADFGLVGYPNAGKSSLLNVLTNAKAKVGDYAFTTLDPNLGEMFGYIIADIPGIIEGASEGRGLGLKFLKHISRTKSLIFCISAEQDDPISVYHALMGELSAYDTKLQNVPQAMLLTKTDLLDTAQIEARLNMMEGVCEHVFAVSIYDDESIKNVRDGLIQFVRTLDA